MSPRQNTFRVIENQLDKALDFVYSPYHSPRSIDFLKWGMNVSLKLDKSVSGDEKPLFVRLRSKLPNGKWVESSISTDIRIETRHFRNNSISKRVPNYTSKNRLLNTILDDIEKISSQLVEEG